MSRCLITRHGQALLRGSNGGGEQVDSHQTCQSHHYAGDDLAGDCLVCRCQVTPARPGGLLSFRSLVLLWRTGEGCRVLREDISRHDTDGQIGRQHLQYIPHGGAHLSLSRHADRGWKPVIPRHRRPEVATLPPYLQRASAWSHLRSHRRWPKALCVILWVLIIPPAVFTSSSTPAPVIVRVVRVLHISGAMVLHCDQESVAAELARVVLQRFHSSFVCSVQAAGLRTDVGVFGIKHEQQILTSIAFMSKR
ncbi:hypothetical protein DOTSEDRAFT_41074 [Dothistroma septosporum NZE10]|uniref:Uncharacterized protein n=1 Tax=Dothistroma septosporum (strain NZE10 / CBS 128990) TaxID=675120 RepID=N1Q2K1_DOTSN|nr:hypothetical protein DOTSEDRAFT_41074 [Dothistroma septosporum NZE10]